MSQDSELRNYYNKRASEYERIYQKPERQTDLAILKEELAVRLAGKDVLEVACGTGYWTSVIAQSARSIFASDQSAEVLEVAKAKTLPTDRVKFFQDDAYTLTNSAGTFDAGFTGFWWSHIPGSRLHPFLQVFHSRLAPGAKIVCIDNAFVEGSSTPISRKDEEGNTYQLRQLENGTTYEVLKNFPTDAELREAVQSFARTIQIKRLPHYWLLEYTL